MKRCSRFIIFAYNQHSFNMKKNEKLRKEYQSYGKWYYHLVLDSLGSQNLLNNKGQCVNAMNSVAIAQFLYGVSVVQLDWMRNHGHFTLFGNGIQCCQTFDYLRKRLNAKLIEEDYPPIPDDWFFKLRRLDTLKDLQVAVSYSARNSYDARNDILPSGYLWSSNYLLFSEINELFEYKTVSELGSSTVRRLLESRVALPPDYKFSKLGYVLPESYLMKANDKSGLTKVQSLYRDSKDYTYKLFRDYNTYKKVATDAGEAWTPSGSDVDSLIDSLLNYGYGVSEINSLEMDKRYELATRLNTSFGISPEIAAAKLKLSASAISKMSYSYKKHHK